MYKDYSRKDAREYLNEGSWLSRNLLWKILGLAILIMIAGFLVKIVFLPAALVEKSTDPSTIISNYEEFQTIYNTCQKIDTDLETLRSIPDDDASFKQFSKQAQIAAKKQQMSRWVEEYNAKSKMINRNLWKSTALPYQLRVDQFPNYNG